MNKRNRYKYIDDTDGCWSFGCLDYLAEVTVLEEIPEGNPERIGPIGPDYKPRHICLVALEERPGMQKYRTKIITNERNPSKLLSKIFTVDGIEMRCVKYVGEQRGHY